MNATLRGAFKSWTIRFSMALAIFGALQLNIEHLRVLVSPNVFAWANIAIGVVVATLRFITTMSLSDKGQK